MKGKANHQKNAGGDGGKSTHTEYEVYDWRAEEHTGNIVPLCYMAELPDARTVAQQHSAGIREVAVDEQGNVKARLKEVAVDEGATCELCGNEYGGAEPVTYRDPVDGKEYTAWLCEACAADLDAHL